MHRGPNELEPLLRVEKNGRNGWQSGTQPSSRMRRCVAIGVRNASLVGRGGAALTRKIGRSIEFPSKRTDLPRDPARLSAPVAASPVSRLIKCDSPIRFMTERCLRPRRSDDKGIHSFLFMLRRHKYFSECELRVSTQSSPAGSCLQPFLADDTRRYFYGLTYACNLLRRSKCMCSAMLLTIILVRGTTFF